MPGPGTPTTQQARMQWEKLRHLERTLRQVHQTYAHASGVCGNEFIISIS